VVVNELAQDLIEQVAIEARDSEYVDEKSGVSARLTISAYENLISAAERRALVNGESQTYIRVSDFIGIIPAITGKVELVYEGEQEGAGIVAHNLVGKAVRTLFADYFPKPDDKSKEKKKNEYKSITDWFGEGYTLDLIHDLSNEQYEKALHAVPGLEDLVAKHHKKVSKHEKLFLMEFVLHGLAEYSKLSKSALDTGTRFKDLLSSMFSMPDFDFEDDDDQ
ncbi:MAG: magnesium chelatase, partial [Rhodobacteraceae bacterium]|nr:magnesium chelatase [Paracoccaceae bacterium]